MRIQVVLQTPAPPNEGWPTRLDAKNDNRFVFVSLGVVEVIDDTGHFTPVGNSTGPAPVFDYTGPTNEDFDLEGESRNAKDRDNTRLTIRGGTERKKY